MRAGQRIEAHLRPRNRLRLCLRHRLLPLLVGQSLRLVHRAASLHPDYQAASLLPARPLLRPATRSPPNRRPGRKTLAQELRRLSVADGEPVGPALSKPAGVQGRKGRWSDMEKTRGFPSWPGTTN